jgi:hypothetical protein
MSDSLTPGRRRWFALLATTLTVGGGLGIGEVYVRRTRPMPRAQIIRGAAETEQPRHDLTFIDGQPIWHELGTEERRNRACTGEGTYDVLMLGSSIFYGSGYLHDQVMSRYLQDALDAGGDGPWCVLNYGQPAMVSQSKAAIGSVAIPEVSPELVLWEMWHNDPGGFVMLGTDAYNLTGLVTDEAGYPAFLPMPGALRRSLFHGSRLFEYASLALTPTREDAYEHKWNQLREETLPAVRALTEAHGGEFVLVFTPFLDVPFAQSAKNHVDKYRGYQWMAGWADEAGVRRFDLAEALVDESVEALRHDTCCHYSEAGHRRVGQQLAEWVRQVRAEQERR